jgi:hypothetical protein
MRLVVYLGGDYEDVVPESCNAYSRAQRIRATAAARQIRRQTLRASLVLASMSWT